MYNPGSDQEKSERRTSQPMYPPEHRTSLPYPPQQDVYPPQQDLYPPKQGGYPPQQGGYPPQQGGYPPEQGGQPPSPSYPPAPVQQQPTHTTHTTNTTVIVQQQPAAVIVQQARGWSTGLCACFDDCGVCMLGLCSCMLGLPIIECSVSSQAGECCCVGMLCPIALRTKIRTRHNIQGGIAGDCCVLAWCHYCAMCQMAREMNMHGI